MTATTKGRRVPAPPAHTVSRRASVPDGDLVLTDGRRLVFREATTLRGPTPGALPCHASWWTCDDGMKVCASLDPTPHGRLLHVSLSYADHYPTWKDIKAVRYAFYPATVDVAMMLPADGYYVNVHEFCMQMWQTPVAWGIG